MVTELITVPSGQVSANWRTPYTTAAINEQMRLLPKGIVRGFYPVPTSVTNDSITLITDNVIADSLMQAVSSSYALTYRTSTNVVLNLTTPTSGPTVAARVYVYVVPSYSVGNDTTVKWKQYTEAEFEAGTPVSDGGLFVCAVELGASPAQLNHYDILLSGVSQNNQTVFVQDRAKFHKNGSGEDHEVVVFSEHFNNMCHSTVIHPDLTAATHTASITTSEFDTGGFSLGVTSSGAGSTSFLLGQYPITQFLNNASTIPPRVRVSFTFKTDGGYATTANTDGVVLTFWGETTGNETTIQMKAAGEAPGFVTIPVAGSTGWKTMAYDVTVPTVGTLVKAFTAALNMNHTVGTIYVDRITIALILEDGKGEYDKTSYNMPIQSNTPISATQMIFPPGPQSSLGDFAFYRGNLDLTLLYNQASANADFQLGTNNYPVNLKVEGDGTNTVVALDGAHLTTNRYVQSPVYRAPSGATEVEFKNSGGTSETRVKAGSLDISGRYANELHVDPADLYANLAFNVTVGGNVNNVQPVIMADSSTDVPVLRIKNNDQSDNSGRRGSAIVFTGKKASGTTVNQAILEVSKATGASEFPAVRVRGYDGVDTIDMGTTMISAVTRTGTTGANYPARVGIGLYNPKPDGPFSVQSDSAAAPNDFAYVSHAGVWTNASSDRRAKKDIEDVPYGLEQVLALQPRRFKWKNGDEYVLGFIAQEVEPILPEVVVQKSDGMYTMHHSDIISVLTKAIQEQQQIIDELRARIEALEGAE